MGLREKTVSLDLCMREVTKTWRRTPNGTFEKLIAMVREPEKATSIDWVLWMRIVMIGTAEEARRLKAEERQIDWEADQFK